jgi:hypothetical protein
MLVAWYLVILRGQPPLSYRSAASVVTAQSKMTRGRPAAADARTTRRCAKGASSSRAHSAGSSGASDDEAGASDAVVAPIFADVESVGQASFRLPSQKVERAARRIWELRKA